MTAYLVCNECRLGDHGGESVEMCGYQYTGDTITILTHPIFQRGTQQTETVHLRDKHMTTSSEKSQWKLIIHGYGLSTAVNQNCTSKSKSHLCEEVLGLISRVDWNKN